MNFEKLRNIAASIVKVQTCKADYIYVAVNLLCAQLLLISEICDDFLRSSTFL